VSGVAAVILAAGSGERFAAAGGSTAKALAQFKGAPMVRGVAQIALASRARPVVVVTGAQARDVAGALAGLPIRLALNPAFHDGLSTSLRQGIAALPLGCAGALVMLADMPNVEAALLDAMIARFDGARTALAVVPVRGGRRGNPALLSRALFDAVADLTGDEGAGRLLRALAPSDVLSVEAPSGAIFQDADTPADLARIQRAPDA